MNLGLSEGDILYIENFEFEKKGTVSTKNKYLIVLMDLDGNKILLSLPSSQIYISAERRHPGCIHQRELDISIYFFEQNKIIGRNGFFFPKDTFIYYAQIFERSAEFLEKYEKLGRLTQLDQLTKEEWIEVLYCALKSTVIPRK